MKNNTKQLKKELLADNSMQISMRMDIKYEKIRHLIIASYLAGQEAGLNGHTFLSEECINQRNILVDLILKNI